MKRALELASKAAGNVSPRPPVGAVLEKDGAVVGEGWTTPSPGPHGEIVALRQAGEAARGAALYVTLEPCSHFGATPPCADALIEAGVKRVVIAHRDPNPAVDGNGVRRLRAAGVEIDERIPAAQRAQARELIESFAFLLRMRRPLVIAKYAMSLDGKIATRTGESQWISGASARDRVHEIRSQVDAVLVGVGTALADNPRLTARPTRRELTEPRPRLRVVVDSNGRLPPSARLFWEPGAVLLVHTVRSEDAGPLIGFPDNVEKLALPPGYGGVDLVALLDELGERGFASLLVEGGATLLGSLFDLDLVDKVVAFVSPVILGGASAPGPVGGQGVDRLANAHRLKRVAVATADADVLVTGYLPGHDRHLARLERIQRLSDIG